MDELVSLKAIICTLLSVGIFQSVMFSVSMYGKKQYLLSMWLALFSFEIICKLLLYFEIAPSFSQWFGFWFTFDIIYGPLLFLWILQLLTKQPLSRWHLLHFLPTLIYFLLTVPEVVARGGQSRALAIDTYLAGGEWAVFSKSVQLLQSLILWHPMLYSISALILLIQYRRKRQKSKDKSQFISSNWLLCMLILHIIMWFAVILGLVFIPIPVTLLYMLSYLPTIVWINLMTYLSLLYIPFEQKEPSSKQVKYSNTKLTSQQLKDIAKQLDALMQQGLFCQSRLSIEQVAKQINIPSHYVSQVINEFYQCNFFDYINSHRLEAIKIQLHDEKQQQKNILEIALENGFNSKSTFNTAFKKLTGLTPSQYRKQSL
ncbi:MAG: helix-turn-helix transcriptional regulator [Psychromonas sp.]|nr:helix-turn-helix transcriptional regulator [Psychromonas sp.]